LRKLIRIWREAGPWLSVSKGPRIRKPRADALWLAEADQLASRSLGLRIASAYTMSALTMSERGGNHRSEEREQPAHHHKRSMPSETNATPSDAPSTAALSARRIAGSFMCDPLGDSVTRLQECIMAHATAEQRQISSLSSAAGLHWKCPRSPSRECATCDDAGI